MKSKKYSRKKNYCASSGSGTRRRFRGGSAAGLTDISKMSPEELADYKRENPEKIDELEKQKANNAKVTGDAFVQVDKESRLTGNVKKKLKKKQKNIQLNSFQNRLTDQGKRQAKERESEIMEAVTEQIERTSATGDNAAEKAKVDEISSKLRQMERGEGQSNAVRRMSDVQRTAAKVATAEREQELADAQEGKPRTKKTLQSSLRSLVNPEDLPQIIENYPDSLNRSIKLKNVKVPIGKRTKKFEDGTSVETNDKRLRRLLSQITQFTEPGDDITLENVDLDFEGHRRMLELQAQYGDKAIEHSFEFLSLALAGEITRQFGWIFTLPFTGPVLQVAKEEMNTLMGFFRFNFGLVLQVVETLYESRNRLKRIRDRGSFDKFSVDKDKSEAKISEQAYTRASTDLVAKKQQSANKIREMAAKDPLKRSANTTLAALGSEGKYDSSKAAIGDDIGIGDAVEPRVAAEKAKNASETAKQEANTADEEAKAAAEEAVAANTAAGEAQEMLKTLTNALSAVEAAQTKIELVVDAADSASQAEEANKALTRVGIGDEEKNALKEEAKNKVKKLKKAVDAAAQAAKAAKEKAEAAEKAADATAKAEKAAGEAEKAAKTAAVKTTDEAKKKAEMEAAKAKKKAEKAKEANEKAVEDVDIADKIFVQAKAAADAVAKAEKAADATAKAEKAADATAKVKAGVLRASLLAAKVADAAAKAKTAAGEAVTAATEARDVAEKEAKKKTDGAEAAEAVKAAAEKAKTAAGEAVRIAKINLVEAPPAGGSGGGAKNKTRAKRGGGGTQLPYDQYADTGYNTGTSFFAFEGDMGGRFDNTFTPTAEQSSFFKSIDYYDKV